MLKQTLKVFFLVALIGALPAFADLVAIGDPVIIGSWSQGWTLSGFAFNAVAIQMVSGGPLELPGILATSPAWSSGNNGDTHAWVLGGSTTSLNFQTHFMGEVTDSLEFQLTAWNGGTALFNAQVSWTHPLLATGNGSWVVVPSSTHVAVPEASTVLLRGGWLAGLAVLLLRRKRFGFTAA